jgi:hypothetical protein
MIFVAGAVMASSTQFLASLLTSRGTTTICELNRCAKATPWHRQQFFIGHGTLFCCGVTYSRPQHVYSLALMVCKWHSEASVVTVNQSTMRKLLRQDVCMP